MIHPYSHFTIKKSYSLVSHLLILTYGTFTLYGVLFQGTSARKKGLMKPHISLPLLARIQFALYRFRSLLLTISQLVSFPAVTKMFQFAAFSAIPGFGDLWFKGCMHLPRAYRSLPRPIIQARPSPEWLSITHQTSVIILFRYHSNLSLHENFTKVKSKQQ